MNVLGRVVLIFSECAGLLSRPSRLGNDNNFNNNDVNAHSQFNNNRLARAITLLQTLALGIFLMKTYKHLYEKLISIENLEGAYRKARRGKTSKHIQPQTKHKKVPHDRIRKKKRDKTTRNQCLFVVELLP